MKKLSVTMTDVKVELKQLKDQIYILNCLLQEKDKTIKELQNEILKLKHPS